MLEKDFVKKVNSIEGKAYVVGGWVRDYLRGVAPKDKDYVITGVDEDKFVHVLPQAIKVGKSFPVYLLEINGEICEVAFARQERKLRIDHKMGDRSLDAETSLIDDLYRRDMTINSMALDLQTSELIDPFLGKQHIAEQKLVPTSQHFKADPVRALRAARQAAQFHFSIDASTFALMKECREGLMQEPKERLFSELEKALQSSQPSKFFIALHQANLLDVTYPQLHALVGQTQPVMYHPEGDAFNHTMDVVDRVAARNSRAEVRFAALVHDLGKGLTPKEKLPAHHMHDVLGLDALKALNQYITLPTTWITCAAFAIQHHMRVNKLKQNGKIVDFLTALYRNPIGIKGFSDIVFVDKGSIPDCLLNVEKYITAINKVKGSDASIHLQGKEIGMWIRQQQIKAYGQQKYLSKMNGK